MRESQLGGRALVWWACAVVPACGGASKEANAPGGAPSEAPAAGESGPPGKASASAPDGAATNAPPAKAEAELPTECASAGGALCVVRADFTKRLCSGFFPDVALRLLRKGTPFSRGYLTRDVEAWNASGGATSQDKLVFDEEVLVLSHRVPDAGGIVVGGASGNYDVLRWDGTCASLAGEELTMKPPPKPKHAKIPWRSLDDSTREALLADAAIGKVDAERRKECKGVTIGTVSLKCVKADAMLSTVVVEYLRNGGELPKVKRLP